MVVFGRVAALGMRYMSRPIFMQEIGVICAEDP